MQILVIEDDQTTAAFVTKGLRQEGHGADHVANGREAFAQAMAKPYDLLIVDRMLPGLDGLSLVKALRAAGVATPAIFLTALGGTDDRIEGLNAGGDDYLVKPFSFGELSARIGAVGRRQATPQIDTILTAGDLKMDLIRRTVTRAGQTISLLGKEFALLEHLVRHKGRVQTRTMLLEEVWGLRFDPQTNVVETHVSRLRSKIDKPFADEIIKTVRGVGYVVEG
ncbi:response regulator transcription factor [Mesorhizobium sp. CAU 1732]|uniref:response regulator transcription factor n=1 Tax=Mesorhizobium sp. CAU 1732 TaxID=3140358 RepID=UPI003260A708